MGVCRRDIRRSMAHGRPRVVRMAAEARSRGDGHSPLLANPVAQLRARQRGQAPW